MKQVTQVSRRKYTITSMNHPQIPHVYRIRHVRDGRVGGFVAGYDNLSHDGLSWISGDAVVCGDAYVCGDALVTGRALVTGGAVIGGSAVVGGTSIVRDATVGACATVHCSTVTGGDVTEDLYYTVQR